MRRHALRGALPLFASLILVAACGSSDDSSPDSGGGALGAAGGAGASGGSGPQGGQAQAGQAAGGEAQGGKAAGGEGQGGKAAGGQAAGGEAQGGGTQGGGTQGGGAQGGAGQGGGAASKPSAEALFVVRDDLSTYGTGCSIDGRISESFDECFTDFFDHPMPSDHRRDASGKARFSGFPNPRKVQFITNYVNLLDGLLDGFSPQAAGFMRFSGAIDASALPQDPNASLDAGSAVQLIDVDDASPEKGQRRRVTVRFREPEGVYVPPNTLAFQPTMGFPLRPKTRYALVVTSKVKAKDGSEIARPAELLEALGLEHEGAAAAGATALKEAWAPAIATVEQAGIARGDIAHLTVFTTNDPTGEAFAVRDDVHASIEAPKARDGKWAAKDQKADYEVYEGEYGPSPDYQQGELPFTQNGDGGSFAFEDGKPKVQRLFDLRFALTVPDATKCPMPAEGYPIVLYAHGTGGDYRSYIYDGTARSLAQRCMASMGIDQIFHGTRPGAPTGPDAETTTQILYFNFINAEAARTNGRQAAIDEVQRARLFTETHMTVPASVSRNGAEIKFDGSKLMFFGHSQGGHNGPLFLAIDDQARGGVLSGSGSVISITLLEKSKPTPSVANLVKTIFLALKPAEFEELNPQHPAMMLAQTLVDAVDPVHYVPHLIKEPRSGFAAKSIYQTEGINPDGTGDSYTPPHAIEVQAVATGLPLMSPGVRPIVEMEWAGIEMLSIPPEGISGNLAGGNATGVLAQWSPPAGSDGHFVVFDVQQATDQAAQFCRNLADDPKGRVSAP